MHGGEDGGAFHKEPSVCMAYISDFRLDRHLSLAAYKAANRERVHFFEGRLCAIHYRDDYFLCAEPDRYDAA